MKTNTARKLNKSIHVNKTGAKAELAGFTANGKAWQTELVQAKTTHGPMDIRLWREVR